MANYKSIYLPYDKTGQSGLYAKIFQVSTVYWFDNVDGAFRGTPANPKISLTEEPNAPMVYFLKDNRTVWSDGQYYIYGYDNTDFLFAGADFYVLNDNEVSLAVLLDYMWLIKKIEEGNWELKMEGNQAYWIYYSEDGVTPLMQFKCLDQNGNPTLSNIFKRVKV